MSDPAAPVVQNEYKPAWTLLVGVLLIAAAYLFPGLVGHDPWKQDEAYSFGIIYNMYDTGDLVVPTLAADPFMEKPPAYYITATGMVHLLDDWLPLHDAARLTTAIYLGLAFLFTGLLAHATWGRGYGALGVLFLISTLGLLQHGHYMITDIALTAGMAMAFYGLLRARGSVGWGGLWLGTGAGLAFLSKGLLGPGILGVSALLLVMFRPWRTSRYAKALMVAAAVALPWLLIWPTALYLDSEELFMRWFWDNNFGRYLGFVELGPPSKDLFWLRTLPWVTFPTLLVALWTLWRRRQDAFANDGVRVALVASVVGWGVLFAAHTARDLYAMPLLPLLAVVAAGAVRSLPRWVVSGIYWFSAVLFGLLAAALWALWLYGVTKGQPPQLSVLGKYLPLDFEPSWRWGAFIMALVLQICWAWILSRYRPGRPAALLAWPAGLILAWGIVATLHLPWIDHGKSYRSVFVELKQALPAAYDCVADLREMRLRESERGMLHYVAGVTTQHIERPQDTDCDIILVEARLRTHGADVELGPGWRRIWEGQRPGDRRDLFVLFQRVGPSGS
ncbi:MAG: glycosyltransferase family 39 protein [Pseudomonadota bacterium]|nr:glycosyltransferase family 39 protein [Pseudomonadota bacterium]